MSVPEGNSRRPLTPGKPGRQIQRRLFVRVCVVYVKTGAWGEAEQRRWLVRRRVQLEAVLDVLQRGSRQLQEALNQKDLETAR